MNPIHGERGKFYYAMKCKNQNCKENLYFMETDNYTTEAQKHALDGKSVRCPMCTQETTIEASRMVVIGVR